MSKLLAVLVAIFAAAWCAAPAFADDAFPQGKGYIEICKYATGTPTLTGEFQFIVDGLKDPVSVEVGHCSQPLQVPSGAVNVTEVDHPWFEVAAVTYLDADGVTHTLKPSFAVTVPVKAGPISAETVVNFTNDPVMGYVEICKTAAPTSGLTGSFTFSITSPSAKHDDHRYDLMDASRSRVAGWIDNIAAPADVTVAVGNCSVPIPVPAGTTIVSEDPTNDQTYVTDIDVVPHDFLLWKDYDHALAVVTVDPSASAETVVTFENSQSSLKVCKVTHDRDITKMDPFALTVSVDGAAAGTFNIAAGQLQHDTLFDGRSVDTYDSCMWVPVKFRAGSMVTVAEATAPGTWVSDMWWNNWSFFQGAGKYFGDNLTIDPATRTVTFPIVAGVNVVTVVNDPAPSVPLKICKLGTATGTFTFSVAPAGYVDPFIGLPDANDDLAPTTVTAPVGQCAFVGYFPYDSTVTITEAAGTLTAVAIDASSSTAVLVGTPNLTTRTAMVMLGNYDLILAAWPHIYGAFAGYPAIVDFTNGPAAVAPSGSSTPVVQTTVTPVAATASTVATSAPTKVVAPAKVLKLTSARIVSVGKLRYVVVRVNGTAKMARIHVTLIDKNHKIVSHLTRYVATNKAVRVGNLRLAPAIRSVKVAL